MFLNAYSLSKYMYMNIGLTDIFFGGRCHFKNIFSLDKRPFVLHLIHFKWPPFHQISCALKKRRRKTTEVLFRLKYQVFNRTLFLQLSFIVTLAIITFSQKYQQYKRYKYLFIKKQQTTHSPLLHSHTRDHTKKYYTALSSLNLSTYSNAIYISIY